SARSTTGSTTGVASGDGSLGSLGGEAGMGVPAVQPASRAVAASAIVKLVNLLMMDPSVSGLFVLRRTTARRRLTTAQAQYADPYGHRRHPGRLARRCASRGHLLHGECRLDAARHLETLRTSQPGGC